MAGVATTAATVAGGGSLLSTVNPYLGIAQLGIGLLTSASGTSAERAAGRRKMGYIG